MGQHRRPTRALIICALLLASTAHGQPTTEEALVRHVYRAGQTEGVRAAAQSQQSSALEARRSLSRSRIFEVVPTPSPHGLTVGRLFIEETGSHLGARMLRNCRITDESVDCASQYLSPQYPRVFVRVWYRHTPQEVELRLNATRRGASGSVGEARLSEADARWFQSLFLRLVEISMRR